MDDFASESSIGGVSVFHSSEPKKLRKVWIFVYFLLFLLLGFYVFYIYARCKIEPEFSYKFSKFPLQEIPFPAVTICSPLFAKNQIVNLQDFLKRPNLNLTAEQQNLLAANVQACAPELGSKIHQFCPLSRTQKIIETLESKYANVNDAFHASVSTGGCLYNLQFTKCSKLFNKVLTDFAFCFSFNLEGFKTIFNDEIISKDFNSYSRDGKIAKNYNLENRAHNLTIIEANQSIDWNLEKGFLTNSSETFPVRAFYKKGIKVNLKLNSSDLLNLCPKMGKSFSIYLHLPNEILTPFHQPLIVTRDVNFNIKAKMTKFDESLRPYPPHKRNCYFDGERQLKFFKSYTKAHCQFECLTNFTLHQCGCVKFSMPRENSTRICGLNETLCYIQVAKNWNFTCDCLQTCTDIKYEVETKILGDLVNESNNLIYQVRIRFEKIFNEKVEIFGDYDFSQGFSDFGGMLGTFFGASLISLIEIFYFWALSLIREKFQVQEFNIQVKSSNFANSITIHGVQFIFDKSRHKLIRLFWILAFVFACSCCIYNSRESYWKMNVEPETESTEKLISLDEIPFPSIRIRSPLFAKENLTVHFSEIMSKINKNESNIKELKLDQFHYLIANFYWKSPNLIKKCIKAYKLHVANITKNRLNHHRFEVDLFPYFNRSHFEVDELFFDCRFHGYTIQCSKLFKKVMTLQGISYSFNMLSYREIFNEGLSKNFDSYGKFEEHQNPQWSLDQGYSTNKTIQNPARAFQKGNLEINLRVPKRFKNRVITKLFITLPNQIITHFSHWKLMLYNFEYNFKFSATKKQTAKSLRKFLPHNRGCYFQNERNLQFFKSYTRSNCLLECFTNYTLKSCGCVGFLLPHNKSTRICDSASEIECYDFNLKHFPPINDTLNPCACLPNCNDIDYSYEIVKKSYDEMKLEDFDVLHIKFQFVGSSEIVEEEIRVAFGLQNLLTDVGGFLGLYLGCSLISLIEVFYFVLDFFVRKANTQIKACNKKQKTQNISVKKEKILSNQNLGLTLAEIFDLRELFESHSACFGSRVVHDFESDFDANNKDDEIKSIYLYLLLNSEQTRRA